MTPILVNNMASSSSYATVTINLLATGRQIEMQAWPVTETVADLKRNIERQCAIDQRQMRVMCNGRNLTEDFATLASVGVVDGSQLVVVMRLNMYNEVAGQTKIHGVSKDNYGNAVGTNFDLAKDGAFAGATIAVLHLYTFGGFDFSYPQKALELKGLKIKRWTELPQPFELERQIQDCCQLWLISSIEGRLEESHMSVIKDFWHRGNGVYIWGENKPCYEDANRLGKYLIGATMSGNVPGGKVVRERPLGSNSGSGFVQHLITTGLETLFEGVTVATIHQDRNFHRQRMMPLVYGSDMIPDDKNPGGQKPNLVTAVYEQDGRRLIIDTGFTRLYVNWDSAGTGRYVSNAAAWLANFERFQQMDVPLGMLDGGQLRMNREEVTELQEAFMLFDKSQTGYIDIKDLESVLLSLGQIATAEEVRDLISVVTIGNPDAARLNFQEFLGVMNSAIEDKNAEQEIYEAFKMFDMDRTRNINAMELKKVMDSLGTQVSHADVEEMVVEADLNHQRRINYEEFYKIMMGNQIGKKNVSKEERDRQEKLAERRHGRGPAATMAHLRAAQRWDALRTQVMKAVRRHRVDNQEQVTQDNAELLDKHRIRHLIGLALTTVVTTICIVVPLVLQGAFESQMDEAHNLRALTHHGNAVLYYDEAMSMAARMTALTAAQEMLDPVNMVPDSANATKKYNLCHFAPPAGTEYPYFCCARWVNRYNSFGPQMDAAIANIQNLARSIATDYDLLVAASNSKLIARETIALNMCGGTGTFGNAGTGIRTAGNGLLSVQPELLWGYAPGGVDSPGRGLLNGIDALFDEGHFVKTSNSVEVMDSLVGGKLLTRTFQADEIVANSATSLTLKLAGVDQVRLALKAPQATSTNQRVYIDQVFPDTAAQRDGIIEGMNDPLYGDFRPFLVELTNTATSQSYTGTAGSTGFHMWPRTAVISGFPGSGQVITVRIADPVTLTTYDTEKVKLLSGVNKLEELIKEKVEDFDRDHWTTAMRNGVVLVICALIQGFAVFLLILQEKKAVLVEFQHFKSADECQDLKQRDWLTSEALPILRSTIVEDISSSWTNRDQTTHSPKSNRGETNANNPNSKMHIVIGESNTQQGKQQAQQPAPLTRTESQKMRMTAIWTNKFKKIARLKKLQEHMCELNRVEALLAPYKKYRFPLMIAAEVICLLCILVPSLFEIYNNESIRATAELRNLQGAADLVVYYDEALTMSARMAVLRGDVGGWSRRYNSFVGPMDGLLGSPPGATPVFKGRLETIEDVLLDKFNTDHDEEPGIGNIWDQYNTQVVTANAELVELEGAALSIAALKDSPAGSTNLASYNAGKSNLFGTTYQTYKDTLKKAILTETLVPKINKLVEYQERSDEDRKDLNTGIITTVAVVLALILAVLGYYERQSIALDKIFLTAYRNVLKYESRDWLTNDALLTLRTNIISDVRRATLRRFDEADDSQKPFIEVLDKPKDLNIADVPVTPSTMRFMENA
ncbi:unnamed protein product [Amoebophrya sp. A120]|nr:unnamed protein product [Amoebophrya sp. A120]|eukprot:GSA120T00011583001.1